MIPFPPPFRILLLLFSFIAGGCDCDCFAQCPNGNCPSPYSDAYGWQSAPSPWDGNSRQMQPYSPEKDRSGYYRYSGKPDEKPSASDVIVKAHEGGVGSGTVISNDEEGNSFILTNFHVVRQGDGGSRPCNSYTVIQPTTKCSYEGEYVGGDPANDLAIVRIPATLRPVTVLFDPDTKQTYYSVGWAGGRFFRRTQQRIVGRATPVGAEQGSTLNLSSPLQSGQSGGAVYDAQGRLCAVCWGSDNETGSAVFGGPLRRLCQRIFGHRGLRTYGVPKPSPEASPEPTPADPLPPFTDPAPQDGTGVAAPVPPEESESPSIACQCDPSRMVAVEEGITDLQEKVSSLNSTPAPDLSQYATKADLASLSSRVDGIDSAVVTISKSVTEINVAVATLSKPCPPAPTPADPLPPVADNPPPLPPQSDPLPPGDNRILYFTSTKGCPECVKTDSKIRSLKDKGYPITVIDLDPTQTTIEGVPRLFIPDKNETVQGISNISTYLALLTPR